MVVSLWKFLTALLSSSAKLFILKTMKNKWLKSCFVVLLDVKAFVKHNKSHEAIETLENLAKEAQDLYIDVRYATLSSAVGT